MNNHQTVNPPGTGTSRAAPLKNVAAFSTLLEKMVHRDRDLPGIGVFFGPSGWGKTRSAVYGSNVYRAAYVECGQFTTARSLLHAILIELGEPRPRGTIEDMKSRAIMIMAGNPLRPVIVDEAHFVASKRFVDVLREISDKSGAPLILIGEEGLPGSLEQFERVHNRVLEWLPAQPCDIEDFAMLAAMRCPGVKIKADLAQAIISQTKGNTRRIVVNLSKIQEFALTSGLIKLDLAKFGASEIVRPESPARRRGY